MSSPTNPSVRLAQVASAWVLSKPVVSAPDRRATNSTTCPVSAFVRLSQGPLHSRDSKLDVIGRVHDGAYMNGRTMTAVTREPATGDRARSSRDPDNGIEQAARIHQVALFLAGEFAPMLPMDMVSSVVTRACRDLTGEVPAESLPEFVHHAARQRLIDACGADPICTLLRHRQTRRRAS